MSLIPLLFLLKLMAFGTVAFLMTPGPDDGTLFFMPRTARIVTPGLPHDVTQQGNNRQAAQKNLATGAGFYVGAGQPTGYMIPGSQPFNLSYYAHAPVVAPASS